MIKKLSIRVCRTVAMYADRHRHLEVPSHRQFSTYLMGNFLITKMFVHLKILIKIKIIVANNFRYKFDTTTFDGNVDVYHRFIEASKFAFAARSSLGDMAFVNDSLSIAKNITSPVCTSLILYLRVIRIHCLNR
jgi:hypothetical protein